MSATDQKGRLMDAGTIMAELGIKRTAADAIMRQLPKVQIPGHQKTYVKRADLDRLLDDNTIDIVTDAARRRRSAA